MALRKKVKDLMIPIEKYATVSPDATLKEAIHSLRTSYCELDKGICTETGPRTVFIIDGKDQLVGILDFNSILGTLIPEITGGLSAKLEALGVSIAFAQADAASLDESQMGFNARVIKNAETKVRDIMLKTKGTINVDARLIDALKKMYQNKITKLPVYEGSKLVGVLRDADLFLAVADILKE